MVGGGLARVGMGPYIVRGGLTRVGTRALHNKGGGLARVRTRALHSEWVGKHGLGPGPYTARGGGFYRRGICVDRDTVQ